jgi:hypothetical protein
MLEMLVDEMSGMSRSWLREWNSRTFMLFTS